MNVYRRAKEKDEYKKSKKNAQASLHLLCSEYNLTMQENVETANGICGQNNGPMYRAAPESLEYIANLSNE